MVTGAAVPLATARKRPLLAYLPMCVLTPMAICPKTRSICSVRITPACGRLLNSMRTGGPGSRILATDYGFTENIGNLGKLKQPPMLKVVHSMSCFFSTTSYKRC